MVRAAAAVAAMALSLVGGIASADESPADFRMDMSRMLGQVHELLETGEVGQTSSWDNADDGTTWQATLSAKYENGGMSCGTVDLFGSKAGGASNRRAFSMCKQADGRWALDQ